VRRGEEGMLYDMAVSCKVENSMAIDEENIGN
jgi:hypothetical protein